MVKPVWLIAQKVAIRFSIHAVDTRIMASIIEPEGRYIF